MVGRGSHRRAACAEEMTVTFCEGQFSNGHLLAGEPVQFFFFISEDFWLYKIQKHLNSKEYLKQNKG